MEKILISACLLGTNCKYDGKNNYNPNIEKLKAKYEFVPICPEVLGGLSVPRLKSEINGNKVININNEDVTKEFYLGANKSLEIGKDVKIAILKDGSPSCGSTYIYDGTFNKNKINGYGITAKLLKDNGFIIYNEYTCIELE